MDRYDVAGRFDGQQPRPTGADGSQYKVEIDVTPCDFQLPVASKCSGTGEIVRGSNVGLREHVQFVEQFLPVGGRSEFTTINQDVGAGGQRVLPRLQVGGVLLGAA